MTSLTNPVTGHTVKTDEASSGFWTAAGYRAESKPSARKSTAKKAASK